MSPFAVLCHQPKLILNLFSADERVTHHVPPEVVAVFAICSVADHHFPISQHYLLALHSYLAQLVVKVLDSIVVSHCLRDIIKANIKGDSRVDQDPFSWPLFDIFTNMHG